jgi:fructose-specific phosphotransferase system IIA component
MKLYQYVKKELIITDLKARNKAEALRRMTSAFKDVGLIQDEKGLFRSIMAREEVMTTAVGKGLAVPHGFSKEIRDMAIGVAILGKALDFQSLDQRPVKAIIMIVVNEERADLNLKALAGISRMARHTSLSRRLESAIDQTEVLSIIREAEGQIAHH